MEDVNKSLWLALKKKKKKPKKLEEEEKEDSFQASKIFGILATKLYSCRVCPGILLVTLFGTEKREDSSTRTRVK